MNKFFIFIFCALVAVTTAKADPSVSSDAGRSAESSNSASMKRDKSLSADKARGRRETESQSRERAREKSESVSKSERQGQAWDRSNSYSVDINLNGLLLKEFVQRYERQRAGTGPAGAYFGECRPILNSLTDYPVWDLTQGDVSGRSAAMHPQNAIHGRYVLSRGDNLVQPFVDPSNPYIRRYSQCRMTASYWLSEAGERASRMHIQSEDQVGRIILETFVGMDEDASLFMQLRQQARDVWEDAYCSNWLDDFEHFKSPEIECGVFSFHGSDFFVENRQTLSESAIDGKSYKITMNISESQNYALEDSSSVDDRTSKSVRASESQEKFREAKKTATLSKSKTSEQSSSNKLDRGSKAGVNATPMKQ